MTDLSKRLKRVLKYVIDLTGPSPSYTSSSSCGGSCASGSTSFGGRGGGRLGAPPLCEAVLLVVVLELGTGGALGGPSLNL